MVSYLSRDENEQSARWLLDEVWPRVRARLPQATLRLVGSGAGEGLVARVADTPGVALAGFVDDLPGEYAVAAVAVVPVRQGGGVRFKTIEALVHGVPVVTTALGAEGVGGEALFAGLTDDPAAFADALVAVVSDPPAHQARAERAQALAQREFSTEAFRAAIHRSWGDVPGDPPARDGG